MYSISGSGHVECLAGPGTLLTAWMASARFDGDSAGEIAFTVERFGARRGGSAGSDDAAVDQLYRAVEGGGWRCVVGRGPGP